MRIVVTGGAGFIGSQLCETLLKENGYELFIIDNLDPFYARSIKEKNLESSLERGAHFIQQDIRDQNEMERTFRDISPDLVYHLAAKAGVRPSLETPQEYVDVNVRGTVSVLEASRKNGVEGFIFSSSSSVYGMNDKVPFEERDPIQRIVSVYGASKRSAEEFLRMYHNLYGLRCIVLRLFTVYGPRQRPDLAIHKFTRSILEGEPITIYGDGTMARNYTYSNDIVQGMLKAKERIFNENVGYELYNLGNKRPITLNALVKVIEKVTGQEAFLNYEPAPKGDVPITYADISKAEHKLGYKPVTSIEEGMNQFLSWFSDMEV